MEKQGIGICYECSTKNGDSSEKNIHYCDNCGKWFCEHHRKPKFPYFVDWETQFDVQGNPAVKGTFFSEYGKLDGHSDFEYLRKTIESMELQKEYENLLIKTAMDKMTAYGKPLEKAIPISQPINVLTIKSEQLYGHKRKFRATATTTYNNKFGYYFPIPKGIYAFDYYYKKLNEARTLAEVEDLIAEFKKDCVKTQTKPELSATEKNTRGKHWWQK
jgi:hypothetical protein